MQVRYGPYLWYFLWAFILGILLGLIYDLLRLSRRMIKTHDIVINIEDILFLILTGAASVGVAYVTNNGSLRLYGILGSLLGFVIYRSVLGGSLVDLMELLIAGALRIISFPLKIIVKIIVKVIGRPVFITIGKMRRKISLKTVKKQG